MSNPKPLPSDNSKDCPTGWCDPKDGQFAKPENWGACPTEVRSTPKTDHRGSK